MTWLKLKPQAFDTHSKIIITFCQFINACMKGISNIELMFNFVMFPLPTKSQMIYLYIDKLIELYVKRIKSSFYIK